MAKKKRIKNKPRQAKTSKNQQSKKSLLLPQIVDFYLDNGCCYSKTARHFKLDRGAVTNYIQSPEGRELIRNRMQAYEDMVVSKREMILDKFSELLNKAKTIKETVPLLYAGMQMTGMDKETRIAKIQAGVGQGDVNRCDRQLSTEDWEHHKAITKNDKE